MTSKSTGKRCLFLDLLLVLSLLVFIAGIGINCNKKEQFFSRSCDIECPFGYVKPKNYFDKSCECKQNNIIINGDIIISKNEIPFFNRKFKSSQLLPTNPTKNVKYWHGAHLENKWLIPYNIDSKFDFEVKELIQQSMNEITESSCVKFVPRRLYEKSFLNIVRGQQCWSYIGKVSNIQDLSIGPQCLNKQEILHLLMHTLGFDHEHTRPDRDDFIEIVYENIEEDSISYFNMENEDSSQIVTEYDMQSVLHFNSKQYKKRGADYTMLNKATGKLLASSDKLSKGDIVKIRNFYPCVLSMENQVPEGVVRYVNQKSSFRKVFLVYSKWSKWTTCSRSCDGGISFRLRTCTKDGKLSDSCEKEVIEQKQCMMTPCEEYLSKWSPWSEWGSCSKSCQGGFARRFRHCATSTCHGLSTELKKCNDFACDGGKVAEWKPWSDWTACSVTCGTGNTLRHRKCYKGNERSRDCEGSQYVLPSSEDWNSAVEIKTCERKCPGMKTDLTLNNQTHDVLFRNKRQAGGASSFVKAFEKKYFCALGTLYTGVLSTPGQEDLLCYYDNGEIEIYADANSEFESKSISGATYACDYAHSFLDRTTDLAGKREGVFIADFNGDGLDDLGCFNKFRGVFGVVLNQRGKYFSEPKHDQVYKLEGCSSSDTKFHVGDLNGDKKADIICTGNGQLENKLFWNKL